MFTKIHVENFKSLTNFSIDLKPLTILIGPNGSGKSSVIQSLLVLNKLFLTQGNKSLDSLFELDNYINMGSWNDVTCYANMPIKIGVEMKELDILNTINVTLFKDNKATISLEVKIDEITSKHTKTISLPYTKKQSHIISIRLPQASLSGSWDGFTFSITSTTGRVSEGLRVKIQSLINNWPQKILFLPLPVSMFRLPQASITAFQKDALVNNIKRSLVIREIDLITLMAVDPDTEDYVVRCAREVFSIEVRGKTLPQNIARIIASIRKGKTIPIVNEGGGINRAIFLFAVLAMVEPGSMIMIEEPETNLHPKAQYKLARILIEAVKEGKQLLITTHSEHLLFGILRLIAKNAIKLDDVAIYYLYKNGEGKTKWTKLEVDEHGRVKGGLPGFFEEDVEEITEILEELSRVSKNE